MSSHHFHAVVWIDHHEARVFHFSPTDVERLVLHPDHPTKHIHHKANSIGSGHASEDHAFLEAVAQSIADAGAVLVTGPANAKTELVKHISQHDPRLMKIIVGVETVDHPSDGQLVAHARHYFRAEDRSCRRRINARQRQLRRGSLSRRSACHGLTWENIMSNGSSLSLPELEDRIAIIRDNIRQLVEQAAAFSGAEDEARNADRIAQQTEELERLVKQRDALLKS
jgi:hypothetical protein